LAGTTGVVGVVAGEWVVGVVEGVAWADAGVAVEATVVAVVGVDGGCAVWRWGGCVPWYGWSERGGGGTIIADPICPI
jgi:hypothetical protein